MAVIKFSNQILKNNNNNNNKEPIIETFEATFLGVRGTAPTPQKGFLKYGGNTSCVKVSSLSKKGMVVIIFDAGTGIINYGDEALKNGVRVFHLFITHMHYDHIIGLIKFAPLFRDDCEIYFYGQSKCSKTLKEIIQGFFTAPYFPVEFERLPAKKKIFFKELNSLKSIKINNIEIYFQALNHPQGALAYRIWNEKKSLSIVYATDHEHGSALDKEFKKFILKANLLIYDSTFSKHEYKNCVGWGHSTASFGAQLSKECDIKKFAIFHHDPVHTDLFLEKYILTEAKKIFKASFLAKENTTIKIK